MTGGGGEERGKNNNNSVGPRNRHHGFFAKDIADYVYLSKINSELESQKQAQPFQLATTLTECEIS